MIKFKVDGEYIELFKLLKAVHIAQTGGHAKLMIENGEVLLNNKTELRKRAKIHSGDRVECSSEIIEIE